MTGPLVGLRVLELAGIGPVPFCGMLLSDLGADVVRIDRPGTRYDRFTIEARGRRSVELDLKRSEDRDQALALCDHADALIEGFRPGVMERLGFGPDIALARNRRLVYGRMTGWGQTGPYASKAGHDLIYLALTGALHGIGTADKPVPPLNLVADFGGGALYLAFGLMAAVHHARATGEGQVIDCAMTDGTIGLMGLLYGHLARGTWTDRREANVIDGGSHFYNTYRCADDGWVALAAIEPQFYARLLDRLGLAGDPEFARQMEPALWPKLKQRLADLFATRTRAEWTALLEEADCCFAPVLSMTEAPAHPHNLARGAFVLLDGVQQPAPAPRFSRTPGEVGRGVETPLAIDEILEEWVSL